MHCKYKYSKYYNYKMFLLLLKAKYFNNFKILKLFCIINYYFYIIFLYHTNSCVLFPVQLLLFILNG